jgi:hypothetical protein
MVVYCQRNPDKDLGRAAVPDLALLLQLQRVHFDFGMEAWDHNLKVVVAKLVFHMDHLE